jgi:uncharacterized membrane protein (DUF4010 family)
MGFQRSVLAAGIVGGCGFLAARAVEAAALVVGAVFVGAFGLVRSRSITGAAVWTVALLVAAALVQPLAIDYAVRRWIVTFAVAGALAGAAEPRVNGRNRLLNAFAWAVALPAGLWMGIVGVLVLDQPSEILGNNGFYAAIFLGGATGAVAALLIGDRAARLLEPVRT